jgi:hypothetical protein
MDQVYYSRRRMAHAPRRLRWEPVWVVVPAMGLAFWLRTWWPVIIAAATGFVFTLYLKNTARCPECSRRLRYFTEYLDSTETDEKELYNCPHCRITWDPNIILRGSG